MTVTAVCQKTLSQTPRLTTGALLLFLRVADQLVTLPHDHRPHRVAGGFAVHGHAV